MPCTGHVTLYGPATTAPAADATTAAARRIKLGAASFRIPARHSGSVHIHLDQAAERLLLHRRRVSVTEVVATRSHHKTASTTRTLTLTVRR